MEAEFVKRTRRPDRKVRICWLHISVHDCRQTADTYTSLQCDQAGRWHKLGAGLGLVVATLAAAFGGEFARDLVLGAAH